MACRTHPAAGQEQSACRRCGTFGCTRCLELAGALCPACHARTLGAEWAATERRRALRLLTISAALVTLAAGLFAAGAAVFATAPWDDPVHREWRDGDSMVAALSEARAQQQLFIGSAGAGCAALIFAVLSLRTFVAARRQRRLFDAAMQ